jgi:hypothetical protein
MTIYRSYNSPPCKVLNALKVVLQRYQRDYLELYDDSKIESETLYWDRLRKVYIPNVKEISVGLKPKGLLGYKKVKVESILLPEISDGVTDDYWFYQLPTNLKIKADSLEKERSIANELQRYLEEIDPPVKQAAAVSSAAASSRATTCATCAIATMCIIISSTSSSAVVSST